MAATRRTGRRVTSNRKPAKANLAKTEKCSAGSSQEHSKMVNPQLGRPSTRRGTRQEKQEEIQKASKERILQEDQGGGEEKEILKTNKESSEDNIEVLRGSDEEEAIKGRLYFMKIESKNQGVNSLQIHINISRNAKH